jgi:hypothetical protein
MTAAFTATRIDISERPVREIPTPAHWSADVAAAVREGRISHRHAERVMASRASKA